MSEQDQTSRGLHEAPKKGLTDAQEKAAILLGQGVKITDVAGALGVHRSTVARWQQCENFQAAVESVREEVQEDSESSANYLAIALATWREIAEDESQPATARNAAAKYLVEYAPPILDTLSVGDMIGDIADHFVAVCRSASRGHFPPEDHERLRDACTTALQILDQPRQTPPEPYQVREARERGASEAEINELRREQLLSAE